MLLKKTCSSDRHQRVRSENTRSILLIFFIYIYTMTTALNSDIDDVGPVTRFQYDIRTGCHVASGQLTRQKFIKGPIPLEWVKRANSLPGKSGAIGIALWFLSGVQKNETVKLTKAVENIAGCNRQAVYYGLERLENEGLITVRRRTGGRPTVLIKSI